MDSFYKESGIMVCEWEAFENLLLDTSRDFHFTKEQWKNRRLGRTQLTSSERIAMMNTLNEIRLINNK